MSEKNFSLDLFHLGILIALLLALWLVFSWYFGCGIAPLPFACDVFWGIVRFGDSGKARVLIVYGDSGLGDPELLQEFLSSPADFIAPARTQHVSLLNTGNLKDYDLVIVEKARQLSSEQLKMFMDYVNGGGRLVWTGDAGTVLKKGDRLLYEFERPNGIDQNRAISPWARKIGSKVVAFDQFLSVDFVGNFCELKNCQGTPFIGLLQAPNREHDLVKAIRPDLKMYGDFSIVNPRSGTFSTTILSVDTLSELIADKEIYYTSQTIIIPQCNDDIDNDNDGFIDFDGIDLDGDGIPEYKPDPGCSSLTDDFESGSIKPKGSDTECNDGKDNDNDNQTDFLFDSCCLNAFWDDEASCTPNLTECSDKKDNDNDGFVDFGTSNENDRQCYAASDESEGITELGQVFPIIVSSGLGQKIAYYAIPPEFFVSNQMPIDSKTGIRISYPSIIKNMYYGMIR